MLAMSRAAHPRQNESLASYLVRHNGHVLAEVAAVEIAGGSVDVLACGCSAGGRLT